MGFPNNQLTKSMKTNYDKCTNYFEIKKPQVN